MTVNNFEESFNPIEMKRYAHLTRFRWVTELVANARGRESVN